jgi:putative glutamine amidotransferase
MQVLNVARGGTLHQHLPDVVGHDGHATAPGHFDAHAVRMSPGTRIGSILGARATVMAGHHQGIDLVGDGLIASAWSPDGAVEAIDEPSRRFALGVPGIPSSGMTAVCSTRLSPRPAPSLLPAEKPQGAAGVFPSGVTVRIPCI